MMKAIEGFLVKKVETSHGSDKVREDILGVETKEWEAKERIERESEYYSSMPFEYGHSVTKTGLAYTSNKDDEIVRFYYEKCIIITGV